MIPRKLKNLNLFVQTRGHLGLVDTLTPPKLTRKMEEAQYGGMNAPMEFDMGMEKLEATFVLAEYKEDLMRLWGLVNHAGVALRFKGALEQDSSGQVTPIEVVINGRWRELDMGDWKAGESTNLTVAVAATFFEYKANGESLIKIDVPNMIEEINGVDRLAEQRAAVA